MHADAPHVILTPAAAANVAADCDGSTGTPALAAVCATVGTAACSPRNLLVLCNTLPPRARWMP